MDIVVFNQSLTHSPTFDLNVFRSFNLRSICVWLFCQSINSSDQSIISSVIFDLISVRLFLTEGFQSTFQQCLSFWSLHSRHFVSCPFVHVRWPVSCPIQVRFVFILIVQLFTRFLILCTLSSSFTCVLTQHRLPDWSHFCWYLHLCVCVFTLTWRRLFLPFSFFLPPPLLFFGCTSDDRLSVVTQI